MIENKRVLLMGNPNVGKSTVFNELTGSHQHTGNWSGKTVGITRGRYYYKFNTYELVDLPGTYSLLSASEEERLARDYLCFEKYDCVVCVVDATSLARNLNLVIQTLEVTNKVVILLNLCDEACKKNIDINDELLSKALGVPVVRATARSGKGINDLLEQVHLISVGNLVNETSTLYYDNQLELAVHKVERRLKSRLQTDKSLRFFALRLLENDESFNSSFKDCFGALGASLKSAANGGRIELSKLGIDVQGSVAGAVSSKAQQLADSVTEHKPSKKEQAEKMLDKILLGKYTAVPVMLLLFGFVLWLTVAGSNYPSQLLRGAFDLLEQRLADTLLGIGASKLLVSILVNGVIRVLLWVVAVMLPPMAIFFPLFACMEEFGILPRIAFNLDSGFEKCGACGKQALTTCMGYGCNAVGVTGARIIDSPRERLIAIITNSLTPCNGRFPLLIAVISMFFCKNTALSAAILLGFIALSMAMTLASSKILASTVLKGVASSFVLELPPYRKPRLFKLLADTVREKVVFVLLRAVVVAAPAGLIIWLLANLRIGDMSVLCRLAQALEPLGNFIGLDGVMLLAFLLAFPANEIVIPIALMAYLSVGEMSDYSSLENLKQIFVANGWTPVTAICTCVFSMFHFPCSTTLLTILRETKSIKWSILSILTPLLTGIALCALINLLFS